MNLSTFIKNLIPKFEYLLIIFFFLILTLDGRSFFKLSPNLWLVIYVVVFCLITIGVKWERFAYFLTRDKLSILIVATALLSFFWSESPRVTLRSSIDLIGLLMTGVYIAARLSFKEQQQLLAWALGISAVGSLVFATALPQYGQGTGMHGGLWTGIYGHKQILGRAMSLNTILLLFLIPQTQKYRIILYLSLGISIILILLSGSQTALLTIGIAILASFPFSKLLTWKLLTWKNELQTIGFSLIFFAGISIVLGIAFLNFGTVFNALGKDEGLTGRIPIWTILIRLGSDHAWLGRGFRGFWLGEGSIVDQLWAEYPTWKAPHGHNGFLDLWLELGFLGLTVFMIGLVLSFKMAFEFIRLERTPESLWPLNYFIHLVLVNSTQSLLLRLDTPNFHLYWFLYVVINLTLINEFRKSTWKKHMKICSLAERNEVELHRPLYHSPN